MGRNAVLFWFLLLVSDFLLLELDLDLDDDLDVDNNERDDLLIVVVVVVEVVFEFNSRFLDLPILELIEEVMDFFIDFLSILFSSTFELLLGILIP